jgi:hypothetical protein
MAGLYAFDENDARRIAFWVKKLEQYRGYIDKLGIGSTLISSNVQIVECLDDPDEDGYHSARVVVWNRDTKLWEGLDLPDGTDPTIKLIDGNKAALEPHRKYLAVEIGQTPEIDGYKYQLFATVDDAAAEGGSGSGSGAGPDGSCGTPISDLLNCDTITDGSLYVEIGGRCYPVKLRNG